MALTLEARIFPESVRQNSGGAPLDITNYEWPRRRVEPPEYAYTERPPAGPVPSWSEIREMAGRAESLGADTVWLADEILWRV
ncbi:MAG TPA: hypothetical protein VEJ84_17215, partial [Acidimicrobiales bacterium]|nr:hypothetical protein [Acidimicrobiales bacterium]